jgi:hypothetical protein
MLSMFDNKSLDIFGVIFFFAFVASLLATSSMFSSDSPSSGSTPLSGEGR